MQRLFTYLAGYLPGLPSQTPRYYCDYAAATPVLPAVARRMAQVQRTQFGNPSAVHGEGVAAAAVVAESRQSIARTLGVRASEVTFTASGSEANNLAIIGLIEARVAAGASYQALSVVTTPIEHPSTLAAVADLARRGVRVDCVPVDAVGHINGTALRDRLREPATLVTFAYANSEVGVVQPVRRLTRAIKQLQPDTLVHIDAAQAPLWLPCGRHQLDVDMVSLDAGKCHGPKGVGVLVAAETIPLAPVIFGGGQERGRRAGTENTAGIAGAAVAITDAQATYEARRSQVYPTTLRLLAEIKQQVPQAIVNGPAFTSTVAELERLPNSVHISLPGFDTEYAVVYLDAHGIAASTKSACSGAGSGMSAVVQAMTNDPARATSTIRLSLDPRLQPRHMPTIAETLARFCQLQAGISNLPEADVDEFPDLADQ